MAIAAAISLSLSSSSRHSLSPISVLRSSSHHHHPLPLSFQPISVKSNSIITVRHPSLRIFASSISMEAPSKASFLDRKESRALHFVKYQGLGNDFILVDNRNSMEPRITPEEAVKLCDRNFGIGADGVIFALPGINGTDYTMRIFNSDGSEPEMCGNGVRCFARFIAELDNIQGRQSFTINTGAGLIVPEIQDDMKVRVDMGEPILKASNVPTKLPANEGQSVVKSELTVDGVTWNVTCVSMGNPHCVTFGPKGSQNLLVDELNLPQIGPKFEHHEMFPARTNTEFVQVLSRSHLKMRVWERGAGATLACGTGACAVVVAAVLEGHTERSCIVDLPGGPLEIEWSEGRQPCVYDRTCGGCVLRKGAPMMLLVNFFTWPEIELIYSLVFCRNETQACCSGFWGVIPRYLSFLCIARAEFCWINAVVVSRLKLNHHNCSVSVFFRCILRSIFVFNFVSFPSENCRSCVEKSLS